MAELSDAFWAQLKRHEGLKLVAYRCTANRLTIGYGWNLDARPTYKGKPISHEITRSMAEELLQSAVATVIYGLSIYWPHWYKLEGARKEAFVNMAYQLGIKGLMKFKKALAAAEAGDWERCALELADSNWAEQTPRRAEEIIKQVRTGQYA